MSGDMESRILAAIEKLTRTVERLDTTVDQSTRVLRNVQVRLTSVETTLGQVAP